MGADLYVEPLFTANKQKYSPLFDAAVKARDSIVMPEDVRLAMRKKMFGLEIDKADEKLLKAYSGVIALYDAAQKEVEDMSEKMYAVGYFRDSYNGGSLFWKLGLSWWALASGKGKAKFISDSGYISVANAKRLRVMVDALPITLKEDDYKGWSEGTTRADVDKFFADKKQRFLDFLDFAIKHKKKIRASV